MKIVLERSLEFNQYKNLFILTFICFFVFLGISNSEFTKVTIWIEIVLGVLILFFICIMLLKKGIVVNDVTLSKGYFLFGFLIAKKKIIVANLPIISLLICSRSTNYNVVIRKYEPRLSLNMESFDLYLLNKNHTVKSIFLRFEKEESSNKAIEFLINNTTLKFEKFNPNFE